MKKQLHHLRFPISAAALLLACAAVLSGCAGYTSYREGQAALASGNPEAGLAKLRQAMETSPENTEYRRSYFTTRDTTVNGFLREGELAMEIGDFKAARHAYTKAIRIDGANVRAQDGLNRVDAEERHWLALDAAAAMAKAGNIDSAVVKVQQVLSENPNNRRAVQMQRQLLRQQADASGKELGLYPRLRAAYRKPVTLSFNNAPLVQVFEALKQASGLNYMVEREVRQDLRVTMSVTNKPVEDILRLLLATNQLERRVLDDNTLLIYPNTPQKAAEYKEMVVRTFYLTNADATKVANALRTIAKVRDVIVDEKLNMLMVRDSAEAVRLAERLIAAQDLAEPEVMLELEVLEVSVNRLLELGIQWPDSASATVVGSAGIAGQLRLDELRNRNSSMVQLNTNDPLVSAKARSQTGDANLLANPRVRVRNKQVAKILIGERVPVITTTTTANVGSSESVNYLDVGLKLEIEPTVSLDDEVSMKVALEVSNILETITRPNTQAYRLGTRNTSTTLRVKHGETNILAGLIQRDERHSNTGVPGVNELPLISRLFGIGQDNETRTEIVLLITPRIVRNLDMPGIGMQEFLSGTESAVGASPIQLGQPMMPIQTLPTAPQLPVIPVIPVMPMQPMPGMPQPSAPATPPQGSPPPSLVVPPLVPSAPGTLP